MIFYNWIRKKSIKNAKIWMWDKKIIKSILYKMIYKTHLNLFTKSINYHSFGTSWISNLFYINKLRKCQHVIYIFDSDLVWRMQLIIIKIYRSSNIQQRKGVFQFEEHIHFSMLEKWLFNLLKTSFYGY